MYNSRYTPAVCRANACVCVYTHIYVMQVPSDQLCLHREEIKNSSTTTTTIMLSGNDTITIFRSILRLAGPSRNLLLTTTSFTSVCFFFFSFFRNNLNESGSYLNNAPYTTNIFFRLCSFFLSIHLRLPSVYHYRLLTDVRRVGTYPYVIYMYKTDVHT